MPHSSGQHRNNHWSGQLHAGTTKTREQQNGRTTERGNNKTRERTDEFTHKKEIIGLDSRVQSLRTFASDQRGLLGYPPQIQRVIGYLVAGKVRRHHKDGVLALDGFSLAVCEPALCGVKTDETCHENVATARTAHASCGGNYYLPLQRRKPAWTQIPRTLGLSQAAASYSAREPLEQVQYCVEDWEALSWRVPAQVTRSRSQDCCPAPRKDCRSSFRL